MGICTKWNVLSLIVAYFQLAAGVELTFELLDNAKDCFYEDVKLNTTVTLEFQVSFILTRLVIGYNLYFQYAKTDK